MRHGHVVAALLMLGSWSGCGGPDDGAMSPSPGPAATITITTAGVSPKSVTVSPGGQVQFANTDGRSHEMGSDPHPDHTDCPEINSVGFLTPGQNRQTGNLNTRRTCGFHDHTRPDDAALRGTIVVQ
jgi:plastocyanin